MDFAFSGDAPLGSECRRLLLGEAATAVSRLAVIADEPDLVIHETRKHNKRMRGILLLALPVLDSGELSRANRLVRDAARRFSEARDALVRRETCENLLERFEKKRLGPGFAEVCETFADRHRRVLRHGDLDAAAEAAARDFAEAARIVEEWDWDRVDTEIVFAGFVSNYRLGIQHFENSRATRDPHECHEWRKRAKYLSFHYRLFSFLDPKEFGKRAELAEELASWLGEHHDLAVLEESLADHRDLGIGKGLSADLIRLAEQARLEIENDAFERGSLVYLDSPERLHERVEAGVGLSVSQD